MTLTREQLDEIKADRGDDLDDLYPSLMGEDVDALIATAEAGMQLAEAAQQVHDAFVLDAPFPTYVKLDNEEQLRALTGLRRALFAFTEGVTDG